LNGLVAVGAGVVKSLSNQRGIAACALLKGKRRVKNIPAGAGTLAWTNHGETTTTFGTLMLSKLQTEIEILDLFLKTGYPNLDPLETPQ
jgi:uncharacterized membrane-anchored protein